MKPLFMALCGWGPYKHEVTIDFTRLDQKGLFLVTGPTGAGKTTIFDGIMYALYGRVSGDVREKESVRSDFCAPEDLTYVNLKFMHHNVIYEISRNPKYLRPKKRGKEKSAMVEEKERAIIRWQEQGLAGDKEQVIEGVNEVNRKVETLLCLDHKQFKQTTMIAQGEFTRLLYASPREKTLIFRNLFGTEIYEYFVKLLKTEVNTLNNQAETLSYKMEEAIEQLSIQEADFVELMEMEHHPYPQILAYLKQYGKSLSQKEAKGQKQLEELILAVETHKGMLNQAQTIEKQFLERKAAEEALSVKEGEAETLAETKKELQDGLMAASLLPFLNKMEEKEQVHNALMLQKQSYQQKLLNLQEQVKQLQPFQKEHKTLEVFLNQLEQAAVLAQEWTKKKQEWKQTSQKLSQQQAAFKELEGEKNQYKEGYEALMRRLQYGAVGIVVKELKPGEPCPVCGSKTHPNIAKCSEEIPDEHTVQAQKKAYDLAQKAFEKSLAETQRCFEAEQGLQREVLERETEMGLQKEKLCKLIEDHPKPLSLLTGENQEQLYAFLQQEKFFLQKKEQWQRKFQEKQEAYIQAEKQKHSVAELLAVMERDVTAAKKEKDQSQQAFVQVCAEKLGLAPKDKEGYITLVRSWEKDPQWLEEARKRLTDFSTEYAIAKENLKRCWETCKALKKVDIMSLQQETEALEVRQKETAQQQELLRRRMAECEKAKNSLAEKLKEQEKLQAKYGLYYDLVSAAEGKNGLRLIFEQYVLAYFFEDILRAANLRFQQMSSGRYRLARIQEVSDGRVKDSLELEVHDFYTGKNRSVRTLSGGEAFKASLSLALGMSDTIQRMSGGIRVETLFIDEGFGSLDGESLNQACDTLSTLVGQDTFIGLISHVEELKERIRCQIIVTKTDHGSRVEVLRV